MKLFLHLTLKRLKKLKKLTSSRICSARCSILSILPTNGTIFLCCSMCSIFSNSNPSSISTLEIPAAVKHVLLIVSIPLEFLYSWIPSIDNSEPYNSAISLRLLCQIQHKPMIEVIHSNNLRLIIR